MKVEQQEAFKSIQTFVDVATQGLAQMHDDRRGVFCKRLVLSGSDVQATGHSRRETLVAMLGLYEAFHNDVAIPFDLTVLSQLRNECLARIDGLADLGLLLWLTARSHPETLSEIYNHVQLSSAIDRFRDARRGNTCALSWFLVGLAEIRLSDGEEPAQLEELAYLVRQMLFVNYGGFGVFRHARGSRLFKRAKARYGTFQDQIFGMYAFSRYSRAFHDSQALEIAEKCARSLIDNQGEIGQWWYSYEVSTGKVARKYPVCSVHQNALAPLALLEMEKLVGLQVADEIEYGLAWIRGDNELDTDLLDPDRGIIWEGVFDTQSSQDGSRSQMKRGLRPQRDKKKNLALSLECRPSDLGWLLYALSGRIGG